MPILRNTGARKAAGDQVKDDAAEMPSIVGRGSGIRTRDPLLPKQVLYQAELCPDRSILLRRDTGSLSWRQAVARLVTCEAAKGVSWVIRRLADQATPRRRSMVCDAKATAPPTNSRCAMRKTIDRDNIFLLQPKPLSNHPPVLKVPGRCRSVLAVDGFGALDQSFHCSYQHSVGRVRSSDSSSRSASSASTVRPMPSSRQLRQLEQARARARPARVRAWRDS